MLKQPNASAKAFLGGTFDPIHYGHLRLAEEAREILQVDQVCLIPSGHPPHRTAPQASGKHRLAMVQAAIQSQTHFWVEDVEIQSLQKSYTVETLRYLRQVYGEGTPLVWILGADAFKNLHLWYEWLTLFDLTHFAIASRAGTDWNPKEYEKGLSPVLREACENRWVSDPQVWRKKAAGYLIPFSMSPLEISSTSIRSLCRQKRSIRYLLPDQVLNYLNAQALYQQE